ncbi:WGR domain-containing protein [Agrobacterium vitis]
MGQNHLAHFGIVQQRRFIKALNQSSRIDSEKSLDAAPRGNNNAVMEKDAKDLVHLHRIDTTQNMRRFYLLAIQPTLFGGASVIRNWGRIGSGGQTMIETFDRQEDADLAVSHLERTKKRRGYSEVNRTE